MIILINFLLFCNIINLINYVFCVVRKLVKIYTGPIMYDVINVFRCGCFFWQIFDVCFRSWSNSSSVCCINVYRFVQIFLLWYDEKASFFFWFGYSARSRGYVLYFYLLIIIIIMFEKFSHTDTHTHPFFPTQQIIV